MSYTRRRYLEPAERVRELREKLSLTQAEFADRLGVTRRTVIRGEQRGLEIPLWSDGPRGAVWDAWTCMQTAAADGDVGADRASSADRPKCHSKVSPARVTFKPRSPAPAIGGKKRRLRLSRDLLRDRRG